MILRAGKGLFRERCICLDLVKFHDIVDGASSGSPWTWAQIACSRTCARRSRTGLMMLSAKRWRASASCMKSVEQGSRLDARFVGRVRAARRNRVCANRITVRHARTRV